MKEVIDIVVTPKNKLGLSSLLISLALAMATPVACIASENLDQQVGTDAYVYLLGRAIVIRQEHTAVNEPVVDYNVIK